MGKRIGRYEIGKTIGSGHFSKVKIGTDVETQEVYAVKVISKEQVTQQGMEQQLRREIAVMKLLKHENIVELKEVLATANNYYLIMELCSGGELFDKVSAAKRFDEPTARRHFQQLIMGVYHCHSQGIAHRDLKLENLLLDSNDVLKISDFGLSNLHRGNGTLLDTTCGTPNYVAPEVISGSGYNGLTADLWSCGVILFVMLAGYLPFDDQEKRVLFSKIQRAEFRMSRCFSDSARDLIGHILMPNPLERFNIQQIIEHPWFQEGFDISKLHGHTHQELVVSKEQIKSAVNEVPEGEKIAFQPEVSADGMDAFDIIARLSSTINPNPSSVVRSAVRFLFGGTSADVVASLQALNANPQEKTPGQIKGFFNPPSGKAITYSVVMIPTVTRGVTLLEMRRGRGDSLEYRDFCQQVVGALGNLTRSQLYLTPGTEFTE